jgi:hypothetical protein
VVCLHWSANSAGLSVARAEWGAVGVVLDPPVGDEDLGFEERVELLDSQQLVTDAAAVGLDPGVLPW